MWGVPKSRQFPRRCYTPVHGGDTARPEIEARLNRRTSYVALEVGKPSDSEGRRSRLCSYGTTAAARQRKATAPVRCAVETLSRDLAATSRHS
jgi:hypothetical protein